jgi:molecular chaperone HtpG
MTSTQPQEEYKFDADIASLMNIIINSFYSKKDIFLRELISNASDAIDKIRFQSLTDNAKLAATDKLEINIQADVANKTLCISDTGIGMTRDELQNNLGTIAKSGTKAFIEAAAKSNSNNDLGLIGKFGVGFYSAYLVADKVVVETKANDSTQYTWSSEANGTYTITESENKNILRGTRITLHMKDDSLEYLQDKKLEEIIKEHSQFITYPILLWKQVREDTVYEDEVETKNASKNGDATKAETTNDTQVKVEEETAEDIENEENESNDKPKAERKIKSVTPVYDWQNMNSQKPLWSRRAAEVTEDEYKRFYESISDGSKDYFTKVHYSAEGDLEFKTLLYVPKEMPFDMFTEHNKKKYNIKLYSHNVLITDKIEGLMPEYLTYVKGVINCDDLQLNVSREMLQHSRFIKTISKSLVKRVIDSMMDLKAESEEKFMEFYNTYNKSIKLGIHEDDKNRDKLVELLRFASSNDSSKMISLQEYIDNMQPNQKDIFYITGESLAKVEDSPFLETLRSRKLNVLFLTEAIDEYIVQKVTTYKEKKLVSITKDGLDFDLSDDEKKKYDNQKKSMVKLCEFIKNTLKDEVDKVEISNTLTKSPCIITTSQFGYSANMQRILQAQALGNKEMLKYMSGRKTLNINPNNKIIKELNKKVEAGESDNKHSSNVVQLLYQTALLDSGFTIDKTNEYTKRVYRIIGAGMLIDDDDEEQQEQTELNNNINATNNDNDDENDVDDLDDMPDLELVENTTRAPSPTTNCCDRQDCSENKMESMD